MTAPPAAVLQPTRSIPRSLLALLSALALTLSLMPTLPAAAVENSTDVWINEFHYDNTGIDVGEFIEVAFVASIDLSGWSIVRYNGNTAEAATTYSSSVTGGEEDLGQLTPTGTVDGYSFVTVEYPTNGLQNGPRDGFALVDAAGTVVQLLSYEGEFTAGEGPAEGMTSTDIGAQQTGSSNLDPEGASLQLTGTGLSYADFEWTRTQANTAGAINTDQVFGDPGSPPAPPECDSDDITRIHTIQGDGPASDFTGSPAFFPGDDVTINAVVTLNDTGLGGFFVQEAPANEDGDPATSEGLFIEGPTPEGVMPGDTVEITGGVLENFNRTQLRPTAPIAVCDVASVEILPTELPLPSSSAEREPFENMLVTASDLVVSGSFAAYRFGELITGYQGELPSATEVAAPGPDAEAAQEEIKEREVILNDRFGSSFSRNVWDQDPERRLGDRIDEVTGVLNYTFSNFKIEYTEFPEFELFGAPEVPRLDAGNDIAAFNVLNFFQDFSGRGARNAEQFALQSAKIVETILELDAAVLGLVELQNDYLLDVDGDDTTQPSVGVLVDLLNDAAGENRYAYVSMPEDQLLEDDTAEYGGGVGSDAIANGIIYQPAKATQVGQAATFDIDAGLSGDDRKNRWPFAASFNIDGQISTVAVNHFKSKGSGCEDVIGPDFGEGDDDGSTLAGSCDLTRQYAATQLVEWMDGRPTKVGTDKTFLVGDFNSYAKEAPIQIMKDAGYLNMVEELADGAFTYKFSGRVGTLDYILASEAAAAIVDDAAVWQTNSRASYVDLYYIADDKTVESGNLTKGASDHDPLVVSLLTPSEARAPGPPPGRGPIDGSPGRNRDR